MALILEGRQGRSAIVEDSNVRILRKASLFAAKREKVLPIKNITSVEIKKPGPFIAGFIQFSIAGGAVRNSSFKISGGIFDAVQDDNSVVFAEADKYEIALKIKEYIENYREPGTQPSSGNVSVADEILKLKRLADEGILTQGEFEQKKKQLLGI